MSEQVVLGAVLDCSMGSAPSTLVVEPEARVMVEGRPAANAMDSTPLRNVQTFAMCSSPANPEVEAATAAAMGVLTPMPCIPAIAAPWVPGAVTVLIDGLPALDNMSKCVCTWGGVISISFSGTQRTIIP